MLAHGVHALLTFNDQDFRRYPVTAAHTPAGVLAAPP